MARAGPGVFVHENTAATIIIIAPVSKRPTLCPWVTWSLSLFIFVLFNPVGPGPVGPDRGHHLLVSCGKWGICLWCSLIAVSVTVANQTRSFMSCTHWMHAPLCAAWSDDLGAAQNKSKRGICCLFLPFCLCRKLRVPSVHLPLILLLPLRLTQWLIHLSVQGEEI